MRPSNPRSWSDRRLLLATGVLIAGSAATGAALQSPVLGGLFAVLYMLTDFLYEAMTRSGRGVIASARVGIVPLASHETSLPGSRFRITVEVRADRRLTNCLIIPVIPAGASSLIPSAYCGMLDRGTPMPMEFEITIGQAGAYTIPGVILRRSSLLGMFSRSQVLVDRQQFTVLPDYLSGSRLFNALFSKRSLSSDTARRHVTRGSGTDFRELREHHPDDTARRVDWKATARRGQLMVREYEEPREFTIQIVFDGSLDMCFRAATRGGYANAANLAARLAFLARAEDIHLRLSVYNEWSVQRLRMGHGTAGLQRITTQLAGVPRQALLASIEQRSDAELQSLARRAWKRSRRLWGGRSFATAMHDYFADQATPRERWIHFLVEFAPELIINAPVACRQCGATVHPDERSCARCRHAVSPSALPPRATRAVEALAGALRQSRGREMLLFISALAGGEACEEVAAYLALAASGHRTVHVASPEVVTLQRSRYVSPEALGNFAARVESLRNLYRLHNAAQHQVFHRRLTAAGVQLHRLERRDDLDGIVSRILLSEVLSASA